MVSKQNSIRVSLLVKQCSILYSLSYFWTITNSWVVHASRNIFFVLFSFTKPPKLETTTMPYSATWFNVVSIEYWPNKYVDFEYLYRLSFWFCRFEFYLYFKKQCSTLSWAAAEKYSALSSQPGETSCSQLSATREWCLSISAMLQLFNVFSLWFSQPIDSVFSARSWCLWCSDFRSNQKIKWQISASQTTNKIQNMKWRNSVCLR